MTHHFEGRSVVVSGACGGLGQALAQAFGERGARLVLLDRDAAELDALAARLDPGARTAVYDQADPASIAQAMSSVGTIDVFINNAAYMIRKPLLDMEDGEVRHLIDVNLTGAILMAMAAARAMRDRGGVIVNLASQLAFTSEHERAVYSAAKAGLVQFTKNAAREWIRHGIRVCAIAPGVVRTNMTDNLSDEVRRRLMSRVPTGEMIGPDAIARLVALIASDEASSFVGQTLIADNGYLLQ
ncbi:SDR family oxidoreductase [Pigmentiphaga sp.]|uniref:SDR family NAD(P)-dependent oxidoreductase n=1 Tax=Pigmentiphaga sp. TaxID=1977564 RepID=UPI0025E63FF9|nr:SDR family oxidoreductase [Pigmentiphaga sp.]